MKIKQIIESTGGTTSGAIASVASPIGVPQKRAGSLFKGKKTKKKFYEGKMKDLAYDIQHLDAGNFMKKYGHPKDYFTKKLGSPPVNEAELSEQDLIVVPGMRKSKDTSFIPHEKDRRDHEVEMARSDLYAAAKDAMRIYKMIQNRSEDEGLMGWQQSYITLAADYLNSVADSIEHDSKVAEMTGGVLAGGMSNFEEADSAADKIRDRIGTTGMLQNMMDRHEAWMNAHNQKALSRMSDEERYNAARTQHDIDVLAHKLERMKKDDADWEKTFDMLRDRINRYQWTTQQGVDPKKLEKISNIKYQPTTEGMERAVDSKGRTQQQWIQAVKQKFPDAKIMQSKMIDGPIVATLSDGRKLSWNKVEQKLDEISDFKKKELEYELRNEPKNNYQVSIDGRAWKVFADKAHAEAVARKLNAKGKKATVHLTGASVSEEQLDEKKDACYNKVKSRYKVWPSAYASGALVKCRKVGASNWGNKSKK